MKRMRIAGLAALVGVICIGCNKAVETQPLVVPYSTAAQTVARIHWLGMKQIAAQTNAAAFMKIWNEPESARLEAQTLDKLSTAPWRLLPHVAQAGQKEEVGSQKSEAGGQKEEGAAQPGHATAGRVVDTNAAHLFRALLDDCVQQESYLEIRRATNQPAELAFAIHLPADRAALWETNLAAVIESLTGLKTERSEVGGERLGWLLKKDKLPNLIELQRIGEWTVIGIGQDTNALAADFVARIDKNHTPVGGPEPNVWINVQADVASVADGFKLDWNLPKQFPKISLAVTGDGEAVLTHGDADFSKTLNLKLDPWLTPTNLIHPPISSFTAVRGIQTWIDGLKFWKDLQLGAAPNQLFYWSLDGAPQMTFCAIPLADASNRVAKVSDWIMNKYGSDFATNDSLVFKKSPDTAGLVWNGFPFLAPYFRVEKIPEGEYAFIGFFPPRPRTRFQVPEPLLNELSFRTNLVYYDWELTGHRVQSLLYISQFVRYVMHKSELPAASPSIAWLNNVATNLAPSVTELTQTGPGRFTFVRRSSCGFSALDLHLLADWLESPEFPRGLHTFLAPPTPHRGVLRKPMATPAPK
jgi:hypothetical protein